MLGEFMQMGGGALGVRDSAELLREAALRGKLDRLDPSVVREFIVTYMLPLKDTVQRALLDDPESVDALEGRCVPQGAAYLDTLTDEVLKDSDRALDVLGHALLTSNGDEPSYISWMSARARAVHYMLAPRGKVLNLAKDFIQREKADEAQSCWMWNFLDIGAIDRKGNTFTVRTLPEAGRLARDYLRRRLGGPQKSVDSQVSVTVS